MKSGKFKAWWNEHSEVIVGSAAFVGGLAATVGMVILAAKAESQQKQELQDAAARGDTILPNSDGTYWILPNRNSESVGA